MFTVSMENMYGERGIIHSSNSSGIAEKRVAYDFRPVVNQLNKAGSFGFTVTSSNPMYDSIYRIGTNIYVTKDESCIFYGRVLDVVRDSYNSKIVTCEGALAFLNDIVIEPFTYSSATGYVTGSTLVSHFTNVIGKYNSGCCSLRNIQYNIGVLPSLFSDIESCRVPGITDYVTVKEALDDILSVDPSVGVMISYAGGSPLMLLSTLPFGTIEFDDETASFEVGVNVIDISETSSADDIYTHIIPIGDDNITTDLAEADRMLSSELVEKYGRIDRVVRFDGAKTENELLKRITAYKRYFANVDMPKLEMTAVDMKYLGMDTTMVNVGLSVNIRSRPHGIHVREHYVCTEASIDLENPESSSYTFETYD